MRARGRLFVSTDGSGAGSGTGIVASATAEVKNKVSSAQEKENLQDIGSSLCEVSE